jgi:DNA-binding MarR family transcriptional regulator
MAAKPTRYERLCNATAMRKASRRLTALYDSALEPSGLRSTQYAILVELDRLSEAPPTLRELADMLVMDRSSLGHNLRPLERDGLIEMRQSTEDKRCINIVLTQTGKARFGEAKLHWKKAQDHFKAVFGAKEAASLRVTLLGIAHNDRLAVVKY